MPQLVDYQRIKATAVIVTGSDIYYPGHEYLVSPAIYNGQTADGKNFKDLCEVVSTETLAFGP